MAANAANREPLTQPVRDGLFWGITARRRELHGPRRGSLSLTINYWVKKRICMDFFHKKPALFQKWKISLAKFFTFVHR